MASKEDAHKYYVRHREACLEAQRSYRHRNAERIAAHRHEYYLANKERIAVRAKWRGVKNLYGLTPEDYDELYQAQGGRCMICGRHQSDLNQTLCVDHDHESNEIRGLLCRRCNAAIGLFQENQEVLERAAAYLRRE